MQFKKVAQAELADLVWSGGYPGGTRKVIQADLEEYIARKVLRVKDTEVTERAIDAYRFCSWAKTKAVQAAEDGLLAECAEAGACPYNHHKKSNISAGTEGIVYVLHD